MGCRTDGEVRGRDILWGSYAIPPVRVAPDSRLVGAGRTVINVEWAATRDRSHGVVHAARVVVAVVVVVVGSQPARTSSPALRRM